MQLQNNNITTTNSPSAGHSLQKSSSILIIGGGTWGISTALHLARRGYSDITVLDSSPSLSFSSSSMTTRGIPSSISAGNDINKILELSSSAPPGSAERIVADKLAHDAVTGWRDDPVFKGLFRETGVICAASTQRGIEEGLEDGKGYTEEEGWIELNKKQDFWGTMPKGVLTGEFKGWKGWWKKEGCGWVEARKGIERAAVEAERLGVRIVTGEKGNVQGLIYEDGDVKGAVVEYGEPVRADRTILCAGANAPRIFDMQDQLRPTAWTLAHIRLSREEAQLYKNLPVLFNIERGFFMEPDAENCDIKICDEHPGYCNWGTNPDPDGNPKRSSTPFAYHQIPKESETRIRSLLHETMPQLADRPFSFARICWCADTPDRAFLISRHPRYASLVVGVGGSGHGYSYIPAIGGVIADCLEGTMDPLMKERFRWRPETAVGRDWTALQDRFGPEGADYVMDFQKVIEWTKVGL